MPSVTRSTRPLRHGWTVRPGAEDAPEGTTAEIPARVPGTARTALIDAALDAREADGQRAWRETSRWTFRTTFAATPVTQGERIDLVCDGLDTVAEVRLNGAPVGRTANMHRTYRFDVGSIVRGGANTLAIEFASSLDYTLAAATEAHETPYRHPFHALRDTSLAALDAGEPASHSVGIWRGVHLERWRTARLADVRPTATVVGADGRVEVRVEVERSSSATLTVYASVGGIETSAVIPPGETTAVMHLAIPAVDRWWPRGYGAARLYDFQVDLHSEDEQLDTYTRRIGFRTAEIIRVECEAGSGFGAEINGRRVVLKGADWTPDDAFHAGARQDRLRAILGHAVGAHLNLLRVWGGGAYETNDFYALCDELGIIVWQDVPFSPVDAAGHAMVRAEMVAEIRENLARVAGHPSLMFVDDSTGGEHRALVSEVLEDLDPDRRYARLDIADAARAEVRARASALFCSHVGLDAPATWPSIADALARVDRDSADRKRGHWSHQLHHAREVTRCIERIRSHGEDAAGAIVWHFNECWPEVAWAAVGADGRRRPLWHALRRAFAPRLLTLLPQDPDAEDGPPERLVAVNDTSSAWNAEVELRRLTFGGDVRAWRTVALRVPPWGATSVRVPPDVGRAEDRTIEMVVAETGAPGEDGHLRAVGAFVPDEEAAYERAPYEARVARVGDSYAVTVSATGLVRDLTVLADSVIADAEAHAGLLTLLPGEEATIPITSHAVGDPAAFLDPAVLVSANSLARR